MRASMDNLFRPAVAGPSGSRSLQAADQAAGGFAAAAADVCPRANTGTNPTAPLFKTRAVEGLMIISEYRGGGRQARPVRRGPRGGLVYRLFMRWFGAERFRA